MVGQKDLKLLLHSMTPKQVKGEFVFCTISKAEYLKLNFIPKLVFIEKEGITLILNKTIADSNNFLYEMVWGMITLNVHSDLTAIGFLAAITNKLADAKIPVNAVSAYYHDHLFIPSVLTGKALKILIKLSKS